MRILTAILLVAVLVAPSFTAAQAISDLQSLKTQAAQGNATAQLLLGGLYAKGNRVPQASVRAYMWFYLAAANLTGELQKTAADSQDTVARLLTPAQLAEGQRLASQCQARQFKGC